MYNIMFQLEDKKEATSKYKFYKKDLHFLYSIADYVEIGANREESIKNLIYNLSEFKDHFTINKSKDENGNTVYNSITFKNSFKKAYFYKKFNMIKDDVKRLSLRDCNNANNLDILTDDKSGYYIFNNKNLWHTLDGFIRGMSNDKDITYYFGSTMNYRC